MSNNQFFCNEEAVLYQEIITLLEWKVKKPDGQLFHDFFPITVAGKKLVKLDSKMERLDYKNFITFKPLKNNKHCQFLVELLYDEEDVQDLVTIKQDNKLYSAKILGTDDNVLEEIENCETETEAKFCIIYQHFLGGNIQELIKPIKKFDEKHKKFQDERKQTTKKPVRKG